MCYLGRIIYATVGLCYLFNAVTQLSGAAKKTTFLNLLHFHTTFVFPFFRKVVQPKPTDHHALPPTSSLNSFSAVNYCVKSNNLRHNKITFINWG